MTPTLLGSTELPNASACIDAESLMEMVDGDRELVAQLFEMFLADAPGHMERMRAAVAAGDRASLKTESHALKGAAGSLRITFVASDAQSIEIAALNNDMPAADAALRLLDRSLAEVPAAYHDLMEAIS